MTHDKEVMIYAALLLLLTRECMQNFHG